MLAEYETNLRSSPLCNGEVEAITTELRYEFESAVVIIEGVPAFRCGGREDELIPGPLAVALGELAFAVAEQAVAQLGELAQSTDEPVETRIKIPQRLRQLVPA